jgi:hypothetical protein
LDAAPVKGEPDGDWVYYRNLGSMTRTPIGEPLDGDLFIRSTHTEKPKSRNVAAKLRIDGLRLTAFAPGMRAAPLADCQPLPRDAGVVVEADGRGAREYVDLFAGGALLEGLNAISDPQAVDDR